MSANISHFGDARPGNTSRRGGHEPLERFIEAKKAMGEIYKDLRVFIDELYSQYSEMEASHKLPESQAEVENYRDAIQTIIEMFTRDKMKVVFFGRTSNGKSTVINAMLHSKVLPQGLGHTTCCFLQVEGGPDKEKLFKTETSDELFSITELQKLGNALSGENRQLKHMGQDSLVQVFYPKSSSKLLQNDVVFLDSPGVDLSPEFDSWIDKHCLDADVFVLVCNAESTLTQAEKNFFLRVSRKLSQPNVFILNNRWDASASESESEREQVRAQHEKRFVDFLVDELKVCSREEVTSRFFFVSAREMLEQRLKAKGEVGKAYQADGHRRRAMEFQSFESCFEKTISKSAISTKFESHARRAREIIECLGHNIETVNNNVIRERQRMALEAELKTKEFTQCREKFVSFEKKYHAQQHAVRAEVNMKVTADFLEEVGRLEGIVDRFETRFVDNAENIKSFKEALIGHIERTVTADLEDKCTGGLMARIWALENDMFKYVQSLLGDEYAPKLEQLWRYKQPFRFNVVIDCNQLLDDFQEDLEFRFSLSLESIVRRCLAFSRGRPVTSISRGQFALAAAAANTARTTRGGNTEASERDGEQFIADMLRSSASYLANGSVGVLVVGTMAYKSVGWKVIAAGAALYGGLYAFERLRWNASAKEQHLKDQVRTHLAVGLRQMSGVHTSQCEAQVTRELDQAYHGLKVAVAGVHQEMKQNCEDIRQRITTIDGVAKTLGNLKGKTNFVASDVDAFSTKFLTE